MPGPPIESNASNSAAEHKLGYDPAAVPISHAATVMLIDDRPELHVLLVHRTAKVVFAPDSWVFPGGRVDPDDHIDDFNSCSVG